MKSKAENKLLAVVRVRGRVGTRQSINETLARLNLKRVNNLAILYGNKSNIGMIHKVNDFVTYGEITTDLMQELLKSKGYVVSKEDYEKVISGKATLRNIINKTIRMHPPRRGYEGIKHGFSVGGALGYRGAEMGKLVKRMM